MFDGWLRRRRRRLVEQVVVLVFEQFLKPSHDDGVCHALARGKPDAILLVVHWIDRAVLLKLDGVGLPRAGGALRVDELV